MLTPERVGPVQEELKEGRIAMDQFRLALYGWSSVIAANLGWRAGRTTCQIGSRRGALC